ncbi:MAG: histidine kinase [Bacteroidetes bacterium GWC2_33_15]|nr:MAG: histidine kinase [Bacteroidetes bacterium GWA2_33_15]OFX49558.1 MAG: histidine kinase [Bacteroidetes bacterium GWC2_33_15]OFX63604.1 MAG: histidine kinase [Bacteroidetes bacterium GWB2_32_14]OFX68817.1 MAG: histidine kinase [Bacteroidetes bacterium GWD2_33_33]HAN17589.1 histidine kinase [Bacteroidales bacterium]
MIFWKNSKFKIILLHILFWIIVWGFFVYFFSYNSDDTTYVTWFSSILIPLTMIVTYFIVYYLIPKYLLTKKYFLFSLYSFYALIFSSYIIVLIIYGCLIYLLSFNISIMPPMSKNFVFILIMVYLVVGIVSFVSLLNHNFKTISKNKELLNKILETQLKLKEQELQYLKMQIHPHFLFNTLNTIYGFALKQSKQTPEIILMLSNLLDYILYQVNKPQVSLKEEVLHIKEYIELEKIRFQDTLKVFFTSNEINEKSQIAPMLLIPFVENAFKHGNIKDGFLNIEIKIILLENKLTFSIRNSFLNHETNNGNGGIGLENIRKRLELNYKNNYTLDIETKDNWYSVNLSIFNINAIKNA